VICRHARKEINSISHHTYKFSLYRTSHLYVVFLAIQKITNNNFLNTSQKETKEGKKSISANMRHSNFNLIPSYPHLLELPSFIRATGERVFHTYFLSIQTHLSVRDFSLSPTLLLNTDNY
jgi:hypothetical protein